MDSFVTLQLAKLVGADADMAVLDGFHELFGCFYT